MTSIPPDEQATPEVREPKSRRRGQPWRRLATVMLLGAVVAALSWPYVRTPLARWLVVSQCKDRGIVIEAPNVELGLRTIRIRGAQFSLLDAPWASGQIETAVVTLRWLSPAALDIAGARLELTGQPATIGVQLHQWSTRHPKAFDLPVRVSRASLTARAANQAKPWLTVYEAVIQTDLQGGRIDAREVAVADWGIGPIAATWKSDEKLAQIATTVSNPGKMPLTAELRWGDYLEFRSSFKQVPLAELASELGVSAPVKGVILDGSIALKTGADTDRIEGSLQAVLHGYVPPHPSELDGIMYGDSTTVEVRGALWEGKSGVDLPDVKVTAGAFRLTGSGKVDGAMVDVKLAGAVPCSSLARSAASNRLGALVGGMVGGLASRALTGSVSVAVQLHGDMRNLGAVSVKKSVGGSCDVKLF